MVHSIVVVGGKVAEEADIVAGRTFERSVLCVRSLIPLRSWRSICLYLPQGGMPVAEVRLQLLVRRFLKCRQPGTSSACLPFRRDDVLEAYLKALQDASRITIRGSEGFSRR